LSQLLTPEEIGQWHGYLTEKHEQERRAAKKAPKSSSGGYRKH
jgi:hypothetical protein